MKLTSGFEIVIMKPSRKDTIFGPFVKKYALVWFYTNFGTNIEVNISRENEFCHYCTQI